MTNNEMVKSFLMYCESKNLTVKTIKWYGQMLNNFLEYCRSNDYIIEEMTTPQARKYINWLQNSKTKLGRNFSGNGINCRIRAVKAMFSYLLEDEFIEKNPFLKVKEIRTDKVLIQTFEAEEIKSMLKHFNQNDYCDLRDSLLMRLLYDTGIRISEALSLKIVDVDLERNMIKVFGKGHKERMVPFGRNIKRSITKYLAKRKKYIQKDIDDGYLFGTKQGTALMGRNVIRKFQAVGKKAGIEGKRLSPHTFRHTAAKAFLMQGGDLFSLQQIMGHSDLSTTRKYINLLTEDIQKKHRQFSPLDNL